MSQLLALVWLKWTLFRNSMRSRKAVVGRVVAALGMLAGLALALLVAASRERSVNNSYHSRATE